MPQFEGNVVPKIVALNTKCSEFWKVAHGWAPPDAAELLAVSRLDWQVSLSETLNLWNVEPNTALTSGELILAWANLGALVEGTCKLFFSVFYMDYQNDTATLKALNAYDHKKNVHKKPDALTLEFFRVYIQKKKLFDADTISFLLHVQQRRNAIHAFKDRDIGTTEEFEAATQTYYTFLVDVESRLPYPDHS